MFKFNRVIGLVILLGVIYGLLQTFGLLPEWTPVLFPRPVGPPSP